MNNLSDIELPSRGLIVFGARSGMGLTSVGLKLANHLSDDKKVLFISFQNFHEALSDDLKKLKIHQNQALTIHTNLPYFHFAWFHELAQLIRKTQPSYIFLDDLKFLHQNKRLTQNERDDFLKELKSLTTELNTCFILNVPLDNSFEQSGGDYKPMIKDFNWSRQLMNIPSQIYSMYRPTFYGILEDSEGNSLMDQVEFTCLKNLDDRSFEGRTYQLTNTQSLVN